MTLVFATNNPHKVAEVNDVLRGANLEGIEVVTMTAVGHTTDLPETHETILENAIEKAEYLHNKYGVACFSEDTGLEIDVLNGEPGVHTAHYSGSRNPADNIAKVLNLMHEATLRTARFRTIIVLILRGGEQYVFEGICEGVIRLEPAGEGGFGYDPIFEPVGYNLTFAELPMSVKSNISHRGRATAKLIDFLRTT
ncbi:MAG: RdgB/HAM1 family non-canonical purine NTP pyrophosphatase [Saprospiraceae bacterium]|nr:RdgB/HAM1 family non-canonical purine NTP pyrophosphatase [Saprospiraceae bacterium]